MEQRGGPRRHRPYRRRRLRFHNDIGSGEIHGPGEYRALVEQFRASFSNVNTDFEELIVMDDWVAIRFTLRARHVGEFMGIEPTNRDVERRGIVIEHVEDGKMTEKYISDDKLEFFTQLGAIDPPAELPSR